MREQQCDYVLKTASERGVRMVRMWFTDVLGNLKSFAISQNELENALNDGMTFDGSSIDGFSRVQESDVLAIPDPDTFQILPLGDKGAAEARVFCDIHNLDGTPFTGDPRQVLRRHVEEARAEGLTFYIAPDIEFFYFDTPQPGERPTPLDNGGYFDLTTRDVTGDLRKQTIRTLEQIGIPVEYSFHEDSPSQQEIDLRHDDALTIADSVMTFRLIVREVAAAHGVYATFMPKPFTDKTGNGLHAHLSLWTADTDEPLFIGGDDDSKGLGLSEMAYHFAGGLIDHAPGLAAVACPIVNSYKRMGVGAPTSGATWAPAYAAFGGNNRTQMIRVPEADRLEIRVGDGAANPYLMFAAMLACGLDGVDNATDPGEPNTANLYTLPADEVARRGIVALPRTLVHAAEALEADDVLGAGLGMTPDGPYRDYFAEVKRDEFFAHHHEVTAGEVQHYLTMF